MTDKQKDILKAALILFAEQGYAATSTNKVAKEAGVSEGLIFRHFTNKEGLLNAILQLASASANREYETILTKRNPQEIIRAAIEMPFNIHHDQYLLWRLIQLSRWQQNSFHYEEPAEVRNLLASAFSQLAYSDPEAESETLLLTIDGVVNALLADGLQNRDAIRSSILQKYNV